MFILDQDRINLVNLDHAIMVSRYEIPEDDTIEYVAHFDNYQVNLGKYEDTPEHENQLERIAQCSGAINVFYVPKE